MVCMLAACYLNSIQHVAVSLLYMLNQNVYLCWSSCCYIVLCWKTRSKWNQLVVTVEKKIIILFGYNYFFSTVTTN